MLKFIENGIKKQQQEMDDWYKEHCEKYPGNGEAQVIANVPYIDDGQDTHKMDIYSPAYHEAPMPVIIDFHGGGLLMCDRKVNHWFCCEMARRGALVFSVDYPLVPDTDVNGIFADVYEALMKIDNIVADCGGDKKKITLCGDSAGAFIAMYLAAACNDEELARAMGIWNLNMPIKSVVGISGMYYSSKIDKQGLFVMRNAFYGKKFSKNRVWPYVNPETILAFVPSVMMFTSTGDYLRSYTVELAHAMMEAGKDMILRDIDNNELKHDFVALQHDAEESQQMMDEIMTFISRY
ncbi:MAG: alpha/beta hydrolase [Eubacterium sp.]|nr:alpha/beta hydrolase [Candidatus Colimonas fimequi]